jgi:DNA-binding MarR family transcriptional regulator
MSHQAHVPVPLEDQLCYAIYSTGIAIQRAYKPLLDRLGLTYPQYLVLNLLWRDDGQTVGGIAGRLALESSTLTPLLKRLEASGLVQRTRNPSNERQVIVALTDKGRDLRSDAACLNQSLLELSGRTLADLAALNKNLVELRTAIYQHVEGWNPGDTPKA